MFRNLQIRSKLVAILVLPLLALTVLASSQVLASVSRRVEADRLNRVTQLASGLTVLVDALQRERASSSGYAASGKHAGHRTMAAARTAALRQATLGSAAMLLVVGLAVGSSLALARSMARPLLLLERTVRRVAEQQLPRVVEQLQQADEAVDLAAIAEEAATAVPVVSWDEIGRLANAFNSIHRVAVRVAAAQAALRRSIGDMLVNLARRSQT